MICAVTSLLCLPFLSQAQTDVKAASRAAKLTPDLLRAQASRGNMAPRAVNGLQIQDNYVMVDGAIAIEAVATGGDGQALLNQLQALGLREGVAYKSMIFGYLPIDRLDDLKDLAVLNYARPYYTPETNVGRVTSQGDRAMRADIARTTYGVTGAGSKVGILSDTYNALGGAAAGVASDDLPAGVQVIADLPTGSDEGRAMAEIVHDVAPGAAIAFNTAFNGQAGFAKGIIDLAQAGCNIIVDDIIYLAEPFFQDGIIAQAVDQVVVNNKATYFSSAGNQARSSYQAPWSNSGISVPGFGVAHDFGGGDIFQKVTIPAGGTLRLSFQWDDPFRSVSGGTGAKTDLDILIYRNGALVQGSLVDNLANGDPAEVTGTYTNTTGAPLDVDVVIVKYAGPDPSFIKWVNFGSRTIITEYDTRSGASFGHSSAARAISVGAAPYFNTPAYNPNLTTAVVEAFSSAGGTPFFFDGAGQRISQNGIVREKPEITAADGGNNTFFSTDFEPDGFPNFFGTSSSAPHAAAVAALLQQKAGNKLSPTDVLSVLQKTALDMDDPLTPGFDTGFDFRTGYGFIQADKALLALAPNDLLSITSFTCNTTNSVLSSVNFVVGYPNGSFTPAIAPLFINGVTASGQLGVPYTFAFDGNASTLSIQDQATRSTYLTWNFRQACASQTTPNRAPVFLGLPQLTATVGSLFRYDLPSAAFSDPDGQPLTYAVTGLPASLTFDAFTQVITGLPTAPGTVVATVTATDPAGLSASGTLTIAVSATMATPAPVELAITSFTCNNTNTATPSIDFVVGYADSTFTPPLPPLFINGVTASGQLGVRYTLNYDANQFVVPIQDAATRATYFVFNFRGACGNLPVQNRPPVYNGGIPATLAGTVGVPFSYTVPATAFTDPDGQAALRYTASGLPTGLTIGVTSRLISGTPTVAGTRSATIIATDASGASARTTVTFVISATATPPATLTVTSFTCNTTNSMLSSVNFVLGYTNGTFAPTVPPLFINGVTASGQLGTPYSFAFDANAVSLPIQDAATRSTYFVWNFRAACATAPSGSRLAAEAVAPLQISALGNPVRDMLDVDVTGAEGSSLTLFLTDGQGRTVGQQRIERAGVREQVRFNVGQQSVGILLLRATTPTQSKVVRVLKAD